MISFKGAHFPKEVTLYAVFFYVRYGVSYRDFEAIMEKEVLTLITSHSTYFLCGKLKFGYQLYFT